MIFCHREVEVGEVLHAVAAFPRWYSMYSWNISSLSEYSLDWCKWLYCRESASEVGVFPRPQHSLFCRAHSGEVRCRLDRNTSVVGYGLHGASLAYVGSWVGGSDEARCLSFACSSCGTQNTVPGYTQVFCKSRCTGIKYAHNSRSPPHKKWTYIRIIFILRVAPHGDT